MNDVEKMPIGRPRVWLAVWALARREVVRFLRQRSRFIGALAQPILFWILFGAGLHGSFEAPSWAANNMSYQEYFFPGIAVLILLFTSIFSSISIIEDRHEGFLQGVLVAPVSRLALVLGKLTGGTALAMFQAVLFLGLGAVMAKLGLAPAMSIEVTWLSGLELLSFMSLVAFGLAALGFVIAWKFDSVQGFHAIMSIFLMPMWLLSGSFFPGEGSGVLAWVVRLNPLTYGVAGVRRLLYASNPSLLAVDASGLPSLGRSVVVSIAFAAVCVAGAVVMARQTQTVRKVKKVK